MSDNSDDDIWARVRRDSESKTKTAYVDRTDLDMRMEPSERSRGSLQKSSSREPNSKLAWETTEEEADGPPRPKRTRKRAKQPTPTLLIGSIGVAVLWLIGAGIFLMQNAGTFGASGSSLLFSLVILLLGPAFSLLAGFMGESVSKSNREARALINAARRLLEPEQAGENAVRTTALAVRGEIGRLEGAIGDVADRLRLIESNVQTQTTALSAAGSQAQGGADKLVATMENERQRLDSLLAAMADLAGKAQASTNEASQNIDARAAQLALAADTLVNKSTQASDVASGAAQRLDAAAQRAVDAITQLDQAAGRGEAALARAHDLMVLARLRADEAVGSVGSAVTSLHDAATSATETARVVSETIQAEASASRDAGLATVEEIRAATIANAQVVSDALRKEAEAAQVAGAETLSALKASAEAVRFAAEEARQQTSQQMADNQRRMDEVRQTAFEAGKEADAFMQTRISDARALIEQSAGLLDETGAKIQERFGRLAAACADQARAVEDLLDTLDRRMENLPQEATARAQAIEAALNETLSRLTDAGRKAADETAALDSAFQDRLRDSYSALGEVVQRLGGLSGVLAPTPFVAQHSPNRQTPTRADAMPAAVTVEAPQPQPAPIPVPATGTLSQKPTENVENTSVNVDAQTEETRVINKQVQAEVAAETAPAVSAPVPAPPAFERSMTLSAPPLNQAPRAPQKPKPTAEAETTKPMPPAAEPQKAAQPAPLPPLPPAPTTRLKISSPMPIEDDPFAELQIGRSPPKNPEGAGGWSWKQVLSTLDEKGAANESKRIGDLMRELGLEAAVTDGALEKLRAMASRSRDQARRGTRDILPDEVRAMRRRLVADPELRASIVRFVEARRESAARGRLAGNEARVYLVADAALEA